MTRGTEKHSYLPTSCSWEDCCHDATCGSCRRTAAWCWRPAPASTRAGRVQTSWRRRRQELFPSVGAGDDQRSSFKGHVYMFYNTTCLCIVSVWKRESVHLNVVAEVYNNLMRGIQIDKHAVESHKMQHGKYILTACNLKIITYYPLSFYRTPSRFQKRIKTLAINYNIKKK